MSSSGGHALRERKPVAVEVVPGCALRSFVVRGAQPVAQGAAHSAAPQAGLLVPPAGNERCWSPRAGATLQLEEPAGVARSLDELARRLGSLESSVQALAVRALCSLSRSEQPDAQPPAGAHARARAHRAAYHPGCCCGPGTAARHAGTRRNGRVANVR